MSTTTLAQFLATDIDGAFRFARRLQHASNPPNHLFLEELRRALPQFANCQCHDEGSTDWAHLVAGLMIAADWDPDGFAGVAAPFLTSEGTAVWTAAHGLLMAVSRLDQRTYDLVVGYAPKCPGNCDRLLAQLRSRIE
jgi:hypothetical protein